MSEPSRNIRNNLGSQKEKMELVRTPNMLNEYDIYNQETIVGKVTINGNSTNGNSTIDYMIYDIKNRDNIEKFLKDGYSKKPDII